MSKKEYNIEGRVRDNVFYDTFEEVVAFYQDSCKMEIWEDALTITMYDTDNTIGLFADSDIIVVYDKEEHKPSIVTERIYRKDYSLFKWYKLTRMLKAKASLIKHELGFNIKISFGFEHIDYVHYKEEWWQWALKNAKS